MNEKRYKLGLKTSNIFLNVPGKVSPKVLEIISTDKGFKFRRKDLEKIKKELKGKDLSMHTQCKRVFTEQDKNLRELEINILKSEILACEFLGAKELIVHLTNSKLKKKEIETFNEVLKFAKKHKVEIVYEMNGKFNGKNYLYNLKQFKGLKVNLDLGHLNTAIVNKTLKMPTEDFIKQIRDKIIYMHIHNNLGEDTHVGLKEGNLDWESIMDLINVRKVRKFIIEVHDFQYYKATKKTFEDYLKKRLK